MVVLQAETRNTRLLRNVARKLGNAPTSRAKLLHKLKVPDLVPLAAAKATMPVAGDPTLTLLTPKPIAKHAWELGRGPKVTPSPNKPINLEAPTRRAPSYSQQLARVKNEALSLRDNPGKIRKGPVLDSGANSVVISGKDAAHAKFRYPLKTPIEMKGINGVVTATEGCVLQVGKLEI